MWRVHPVEGYYYTRMLTGLWSTQAKVEGSVLKATCHWGSNGSVTNSALGEAGRTPLYVGLASVWGSVGRECFPYVSWESSLNGDSTACECMNERMNQWLRKHSILFYRSSMRGT